jgi:hypothetical protein
MKNRMIYSLALAAIMLGAPSGVASLGAAPSSHEAPMPVVFNQPTV